MKVKFYWWGICVHRLPSPLLRGFLLRIGLTGATGAFNPGYSVMTYAPMEGSRFVEADMSERQMLRRELEWV